MTRSPLVRALLLGLGSLALSAHAAKTLTVCTENSPEGFDIAQYTAIVTMDASMEPIYNRLVEFERGTTRLVPGLAENWDISKDGLTYTFHLRKNVRFHTTDYFKPNRNFNADDVVFSFRRMIDKTHPWNKLARNGFPYAESMEFPTLLKSVDKLDDTTVRLTLARPEAPFLADLAMGFASIFSAEYADQLLKTGKADDLNFKPVGTGPFIFRRYEKDAQVRYDANPEYFRGKAPIDKLIFAISVDPSVRLQKLRAGECQIALYPRPADVPLLQKESSLKIASINPLNISYLAFNTQHKPLDNKLVRQALSMAVDKQSYIKALFGAGNASPATNPFPPTMWGYNKSVKDYEYNPQKAKDLLTKAGFPNGFDLTLWARIGGASNLPNAKLAAELVQADWKKVGVNVTINQIEWGELLKRAKKGEHDTMFNGWTGDNGDPDNFLTPILSCAAAQNGDNNARWCNPKFDELLDKAKASSDITERTRYYEEAQRLFKEDAPWVTLVHPTVFAAMSRNVDGYRLNPLGTNNYYGVTVH